MVTHTWTEPRRSLNWSLNWKCKDSQETSQSLNVPKTNHGSMMNKRTVREETQSSHFSLLTAKATKRPTSTTTQFCISLSRTLKPYKRENHSLKCRRASLQGQNTYSSSTSKGLRSTMASRTWPTRRWSISWLSHQLSLNNAPKPCYTSCKRTMWSLIKMVKSTTHLSRIEMWSKLWKNKNLLSRSLWCKLI